MEYSLQQLNKTAKLQDLTLNNFVETLNLIGLEVDDIILDNSVDNVNLNDIKLELKIPANREDLLNQNILIEELSTIFLFKIYKMWRNLQEKYFFLLKQKYNFFSGYSTEKINSKTNGFLTYGIKIDNLGNKKIPTWLRKKLLNINNNEIDIIESLINLVVYEWGQNFNSLPYELNELNIQRLQKAEEYILENEMYFLKKGTIVLKDENDKIVSVLGIIKSKSKKEKLLLEASFYDINKNILSLNDVNTKVSFRYLRRMFLMHFKQSFQRLLTLIEIVAEGKINLTIFKNHTNDINLQSSKILKVKKRAFKDVLNIDNYDIEIFERSNLKIICTTINSLYFRIPDSRKDLIREIDLIEEYARFIGYKNFQEIFPPIVANTKINEKTKKIEKIKQFLLNYNFNEVFTNSLVSETKRINSSVALKNPLNSDLALLRNSLIPNILEIYPKNLRFGINYLKFFEIGRVYESNNGNIRENEMLACSFAVQAKQFNSKLEFFTAKSFIEQFLLNFNNIDFSFEKNIDENPYYHPKKYLSIYSKNKLVGNFGEIHPNYKKYVNLKQNIYIFELNLDCLNNNNLKSKIRVYNDYSKYPVITKDLSIVIAKDVNFNELKIFIKNNLSDLKNIKLFDIYFEPKLSNTLNLGVRLEFQSFKKTLLTEEIDEKLENLLFNLKENFQCELKV